MASTPLGPPRRRPFTADSSQQSKKFGSTAAGNKMTAAVTRPSMAGAARKSGVQRGSSTGAGRLSDRRSSRSSMYGQGPTSFKKDPRPLSDKSYQQSCIKKLCAFLIEQGYSRDVKLRTLHAPSTKEFLYMLNFILELIDPSLVINGIKLEEEIPYVLKLLGYPFTVSKNHLLSIGSPHSWPIMLGVLMWLVDGGHADRSSPNVVYWKEGEDFGEDYDTLKAEVDLKAELYHTFLEKGEDSLEFTALMEERTCSLKSAIEAKREILEKETEELSKLESTKNELEKSSIDVLRNRLEELKEQYAKSYSYLNNELVPNIELTEGKTYEITEQTKAITTQIEERKKQIAEIQEHIKRQPMSTREAQELRKEIKDKKESLAKLNQQRKEGYERISELQMQHNQNVTKIDSSCRDVNDRLRELMAILPDSSCLPSLDYNTTKRADLSVLVQLNEQSKLIKNGLQLLRDKVTTGYSTTESDLIGLMSAISTMENEIVKKTLELESNEAAVERQKSLLEQAKRSHELAMRSNMTEKTELETQIAQVQEELNDMSTEKEAALARVQMDEELAKMSAGIAERTSALQELCVAMTDFIEAQRMRGIRLEKEYVVLLEAFQSIKLPPIKAKYNRSRKEV